MSVSYYEREVRRLERDLADLERKFSQETQKEAHKLGERARIQRSITQSTSPSLLKSKLQQIERLDEEIARVSKAKADLSRRLATKSQELAGKRQGLEQERQREQDRARRTHQQRESRLQGEVVRLAGETARLRSQLESVYDTAAILREVYVLESESACSQGTCFNLAGVGLVTCAHVLRPDLQLLDPRDVTKRYPVEVVSKNDTIDLGVVSAPGLELGEGLTVGSADGLEQMDKVIVAGFPNYRKGDSGTVMVGAVAGFRMVSGIRRILVSTSIVAGNSGGPVLDKNGNVVGIAVTGADRMEDAGETEHHGAVPIDALACL
jgi:S1-C subfamily serine protease